MSRLPAPPFFPAGAVQSGTPAPTVSIETQNQAIAGGALLQLAATTTEANSYAWTASPKVGTFSNTAIEDPTWIAPSATAGTQTITLTLTVTGNGKTAAATVTIRVIGPALISVEVGRRRDAAPREPVQDAGPSGGTLYR